MYKNFPLNTFLTSLKEHRTQNSLSTLQNIKRVSKQQDELEYFTHKQLTLHKNIFIKKLQKLYILLEQGDLDKAQKILGEQISLKNVDTICCTNPIVDGILRSKKSECIQKDILFECTVLFPEENDFSFSVLLSLFSNLLDNAIESCQMASVRNSKIRLFIDYKSDFLVIFMQNTKKTSITFDSLRRKTTKANSLSHGFGLSIIEDIVRSHDGFCEWNDLGDIFESRILLRYQEKKKRIEKQFLIYPPYQNQNNLLHRQNHDINNHLQALSFLLTQNRIEDMKKYIKELLDA